MVVPVLSCIGPVPRTFSLSRLFYHEFLLYRAFYSSLRYLNHVIQPVINISCCLHQVLSQKLKDCHNAALDAAIIKPTAASIF
jgi:hypothetical protein